MEVLCHIMAIFWGYLPLHRPYIGQTYMVGTSNQSIPGIPIEQTSLIQLNKHPLFKGEQLYEPRIERRPTTP